MRSHGILHATVWVPSILHSYIPISIPHVRRSCRWRSDTAVGVCANSALVLLICKSRWRLGLRVAVVISRHLRLIWRGVAVVPSRRSRRVRIRLLPLIHDESAVADAQQRMCSERRLAGLLFAKQRGTNASHRDEISSKPLVNGERVARERKAFRQRHVEPVEIQVCFNEAYLAGVLEWM